MIDLYLSIENWAAWISPASAKTLLCFSPTDSDKHETSGGKGISTLEPECRFLQPNQRRRLTPLSRVVVDTYHRANGNPTGGLQIPSILCSTYGEHVRNTNLILDISTNNSLSPTGFSLSAHNAVAGLISIFYGNEAPCLSMATNRSGVSVALIEAYTMLTETSQVALTIYDGPVHESFQVGVCDSNDTAAVTLILSQRSLNKDQLHVKQIATSSKKTALSPFLEIVEIVTLLQGAENQVSSETMEPQTENRLILRNWAWSLVRKDQNMDQSCGNF